MNKITTSIAAAVAALLFLAPARHAVVFGGGPPATAPSPVTGQSSGQDDIDDLPVKAPNVGEFTKRTSTGARDGPKFELYLFCPGSAGATVKDHPTFYWYLAQQNEDDTEVVVAEVNAPKAGVKPAQVAVLMRKKYTGTQPPGVYAATLDEAALQPGKLYQVTVAVHVTKADGTSEFVNSMGYVVRSPDSDAPADAGDPAACAKAGLWYDAIDAAMHRIASEPQGAGHHQLHALLRGEHVFSTAAPKDNTDLTAGKEDKAAFDRMGAAGDALIMSKPPEPKKHAPK